LHRIGADKNDDIDRWNLLERCRNSSVTQRQRGNLGDREPHRLTTGYCNQAAKVLRLV
jgi:hypothetical protein